MAEPTGDSELVQNVRSEGDALIASLRGEIDLHNSPQMRDRLLQLIQEHHPAKLILNVQQVPYMDSSAVAVLVEALKKLRERGGKLYLTSLQPRVKGLLEIARLDSIFALADSDQDALGA